MKNENEEVGEGRKVQMGQKSIKRREHVEAKQARRTTVGWRRQTSDYPAKLRENLLRTESTEQEEISSSKDKSGKIKNNRGRTQ